jgi:hypothetical protein
MLFGGFIGFGGFGFNIDRQCSLSLVRLFHPIRVIARSKIFNLAIVRALLRVALLKVLFGFLFWQAIVDFSGISFVVGQMRFFLGFKTGQHPFPLWA